MAGRTARTTLLLLALGLVGCRARTETTPPGPTPTTPTEARPLTTASDETPDEVSEPASDANADPGESAQTTPAAPVDPYGPLADEDRQLLLAGDTDSLARTKIHYVKSNEIRHDVWFPYIAGLGGAYVGVGSDQNYTIMAVARAELAFLMDIDASVVRLHRVYEVLIEASEDAETLRGRWHEDERERSVALLEEAFKDVEEEERKRIIRLYKAARETVWLHLGHVIRRSRDGHATSWLSNPELYAHVRKLYQSDRIRIMGGDLTGASSLRSAGAAAKSLEVPVKVLYLSNAEEYFKYVPQYRQNIQSLAGGDDSVVLRTIYSKEWVHADMLWAYQVQRLADFQRRLEEPQYRSRNTLFRHAERDQVLDKETGVKGLSLIGVGLERPDKLPVWPADASPAT